MKAKRINNWPNVLEIWRWVWAFPLFSEGVEVGPGKISLGTATSEWKLSERQRPRDA